MGSDTAAPVVLIVEDDEDVRALARHWLGRAGYVVREAPDGPSGLAALASEPLPAVVLLDIMLPRVTGFDVLKAIRADARTAAVPVIMVSSFSRDKDVARGREFGATDYIVKPMREQDLLARVGAALGRAP